MVDIVVGQVTVPDVLLKQRDSAAADLDAVYLIASYVPISDRSFDPGTVLAQSIPPGTDVDPQTVVILTFVTDARVRNLTTTRRDPPRIVTY